MGEMDLVNLIGNLGFPIAVTAYCLITLNKTVSSLKDTVSNNTLVMEKFLDKISEGYNG